MIISSNNSQNNNQNKMVESPKFTDGLCQITADIEHDGQIVGHEVLIERDGKKYIISVSLPEYVLYVKKNNAAKAMDPAEQLDNQLCPVGDISDPSAICKFLLNSPMETLKDYLIEQTPLED